MDPIVIEARREMKSEKGWSADGYLQSGSVLVALTRIVGRTHASLPVGCPFFQNAQGPLWTGCCGRPTLLLTRQRLHEQFVKLDQTPSHVTGFFNRDVLPVSLLVQPTELFDPLVRDTHPYSLRALGASTRPAIVLGSHVILLYLIGRAKRRSLVPLQFRARNFIWLLSDCCQRDCCCQIVVSESVRLLSTRNATQRNNLKSIRLVLMPYR
jgi:hypothetical protein